MEPSISDIIKTVNDVFGTNFGPEVVIANWQVHQLELLSPQQRATLLETCQREKDDCRGKFRLWALNTIKRLNDLASE